MDCKELIENWLKDMGLELKPSKTRISHTLSEYKGNIGFEFLGFNIRQYPVGKCQSAKSSKGKLLGFKTIIKPSKEKIKAHIKRLGEVIRKHKSSSQLTLIKELNPIIRGWSNYYARQCSKKTFSYCDYILYQQLKRWAESRHPKKGKRWVADKYWHSQGNRNWVFATKGYKLCFHADTPIVRHTKVKGNRSIYDGDLVYWSSRLGKHPQMPTSKAKLLKKQKGKCNHCGLYFKDDDKHGNRPYYP
jgi:RNA-directed DNA polymerase